MSEHAQVMGARGRPMLERVGNAVDFTAKVIEAATAYKSEVPGAMDKVKKIKNGDARYLAHEYFSRDWKPMYFSELAQWLGPAKLSYVCSARYIDDIDEMQMTDPQIAMVKEIKDPTFRESVKDVLLNRLFRCDVWVKGPVVIKDVEIRQIWSRLKVQLVRATESVSMTLGCRLGTATLTPEIYRPILDTLSLEVPMEVSQLYEKIAPGVSWSSMTQALGVLHLRGDIMLVLDDVIQSQIKPKCERLNEYFLDRSRHSENLPFLVSPVSGETVVVPRIDQLFISAIRSGKTEIDNLAVFAWAALSKHNHTLMKDNKKLGRFRSQFGSPETNGDQIFERPIAQLSRTSIHFNDPS